MHIVFHVGVHHTDERRLFKSLHANSDTLAAHGMLVPEQEQYRPVLSDTLQKLRGNLASAELQDAVLDAILEDAEGDRVLFSNDNFACMPGAIFMNGKFYARLAKRASWLRNVFPDFQVSIAMALRDPATLVPATYQNLKDAPPFPDWMNELNLGALSWLKVVEEMRAEMPDTPFILWCNEDTPLIWPEVMQAVSAHPAGLSLQETDLLMREIMTESGYERMRTYLQSHPPKSIEQRRRVATAFLDKFAKPEAMVEEIDLEGWSEGIMDTLSEQYETEVDVIAQMPGVQFILP